MFKNTQKVRDENYEASVEADYAENYLPRGDLAKPRLRHKTYK